MSGGKSVGFNIGATVADGASAGATILTLGVAEAVRKTVAGADAQAASTFSIKMLTI